MEWKPTKQFQVDGGLFIVPFSRNGLQSTLNYMTLDVSPLSTVTNTTTQSSALRDLGFQFKGFFVDDRLQYRVGAFDGERDSNGRNSMRTAGYLQYDFFDREKGYLFTGTGSANRRSSRWTPVLTARVLPRILGQYRGRHTRPRRR